MLRQRRRRRERSPRGADPPDTAQHPRPPEGDWLGSPYLSTSLSPLARHCRGVFPNQRRHERLSALCSV